MIVSNDLIIKSFDTGFQLCLIIKGLDNQAQKLNYQINQYPKKSLIVSLDGITLSADVIRDELKPQRCELSCSELPSLSRPLFPLSQSSLVPEVCHLLWPRRYYTTPTVKITPSVERNSSKLQNPRTFQVYFLSWGSCESCQNYL